MPRPTRAKSAWPLRAMEPAPSGRRVVQDNVRHQFGPRAISRRGTCAGTIARRTGAGRYFAPVPEAIDYVKAGTLRPLAVTTMTRVEGLPDIPTLSDSFLDTMRVVGQGTGAPKNTPDEIILRLNAQINDALADPKIRERLPAWVATVLGGSPNGNLAISSSAETEKWAEVVKFSGARAD